MTSRELGSADPGKFAFSPPKADYVLRISAYAPGEKRRPRTDASASPSVGLAPLSVRFSSSANLKTLWDFGDGTTSSDREPSHVYQQPGLYHASVTVTDGDGVTSTSPLQVAVEPASLEPLVRVGLYERESHDAHLYGDVRRGDDGSLVFPSDAPSGWVAVGNDPLEELDGLRSFTIAGWICASEMKTGSGGNRIAFNLQYNSSGLDLVHHEDGRLRLAVNEWPDHVSNDSSPGKLQPDRWTFFAVSYDGTKTGENVRWYFGDSETSARLDRVVDYAVGPTGPASAGLTVGNYNKTMHRHGLDRQFRGRIKALQIIGSRIGSRGVLPLERLREMQQETAP